MLRSRKIMMYTVLGVASLVLLIGLVTNVTVQSQQGQSDVQSATVLRRGTRTGQPVNIQPSEREIDDAATPMVDLVPPTDLPVDEKRKEKNKRHDGRQMVEAEVGSGNSEVVVVSEFVVPDLPVDMSDLIVEGKVTDSNAFLSEDKTDVYSEFIVSVTDVMKSSPSIAVEKHSTIAIERFGGRVRYPAGQVVRYKVSGLGSPRKNAKYLFFLRKTDGGDYRILTAYEMRGNKVLALDGSRIDYRSGGKSEVDKHNGKDWRDFREEVKRASAERNK